jgi:hypothetical protein
MRRDLVADDHRAQKVSPARAAIGRGERGGDGGCPGVVDSFAEDVVHLGGVRGRPVDERGRARGGAPAQRKTRFAAVELLGERALEERRGRGNCARK